MVYLTRTLEKALYLSPFCRPITVAKIGELSNRVEGMSVSHGDTLAVLKVPKEVLTGKYGEDSKLIYDLKDQGGELLSLRYDLTVPFARHVAMHKIKAIKRYQIGKVYRRDQPAMTRGRYREFYQCVSFGGTIMDCTKLEVYDQCLFPVVALFVSKFFLCSLFISWLVTEKSPWEAVQRELLEEKGLSPDTVNKIGLYVKMSGTLDLVDRLEADEPLMKQEVTREALADIRLLLSYCEALGILDHVRFDLSLARGLDYYTGVIYEAVLTGFTHDPSAPVPIAAEPEQESATEPQPSKSKSKKSKKSIKKNCTSEYRTRVVEF
ncbi:Histidyl-tRNA synthetase [Fasciola gigantica]|uniref:Histidyl-tRNA synthetase n=1 Tax=Fasciola gigantica TaxID=46835 RepID=A0A504YMT9_FASGI|nr:Histidyl-tRNA synthetase [Fasciola gigantica]